MVCLNHVYVIASCYTGYGWNSNLIDLSSNGFVWICDVFEEVKEEVVLVATHETRQEEAEGEHRLVNSRSIREPEHAVECFDEDEEKIVVLCFVFYKLIVHVVRNAKSIEILIVLTSFIVAYNCIISKIDWTIII